MKTCVIYHSIDLDGWMSAAIVKHWFTTVQSVYKNVEVLNFIGYNHGQPIPDLSEYNQIIMCDISFSKEEMLKLYERLNSNFIWIDHHISAIKDNVLFNLEKGGNYHIDYYGIRDIEFAACELTWQYFFPNEPMPEIVRLLGRYDCFGHKGTDEEQRVLEFQYGARQCISDYEEAYRYIKQEIRYNTPIEGCEREENPIYKILNSGKSIYLYLCTEAKQTYKNGFEINFYEDNIISDNGSIDTIYRKFICINKERFNPINFGIDYHAEGYDGAACFHYDGVAKLWRFSLYNDNGLVDCSQIAKQFGGGGHKGAAGFVTNDLNLIFK